jgi:hypothetical protein
VAIPGRVAANTYGHVVPYLVISRCHLDPAGQDARSTGEHVALMIGQPVHATGLLVWRFWPCRAAFYSQRNNLGEAVNDSFAGRLLCHAL